VKSKDIVHECEIEFGLLPVSDVINIGNRKFLVKYCLSDNLLCHLCKKFNAIVRFTVSEFSQV